MTAQTTRRVDGLNSYSHIYNKGVENRKLFIDQQDYDVFLGFLRDYLSAPPSAEKIKKSFSVNGRTFHGVPHQPKNYFKKVELIAYSLLPDHFHLLVNQKTRGSLEKLMRSLSTRYAIYYNKKYHRHGSLFIGPYKSIRIKKDPQLIHLTRYLHHESLGNTSTNKNSAAYGYSSYKEYLKVRDTSWIKPEVVLTFFDKSKNDYFKGTRGYANFVEHYELKQNEVGLLDKIIIEDKSIQSDKSKARDKETMSFKKTIDASTNKPKARIPEFIATVTLVFILLLTVGARNVLTSAPENRKSIAFAPSLTPRVSGIKTTDSVKSLPSPTPQVSGFKTTITEKLTPSPTPIPTLTPTPVVSTTEDESDDVGVNVLEPEPKETVVITITDGSPSVNLHLKPSITSEKIGIATEGKIFEYVSLKSGWYEIRLEDATVAYISTRYAQINDVKEKEDL